jgi:hypothetical protein
MNSIDTVQACVLLPLAWCSVRDGANTTVCSELVLSALPDTLKDDRLPLRRDSKAGIQTPAATVTVHRVLMNMFDDILHYET